MTDPFETTIFERLSEPFLPDQIHWRVGSTNKDKTKGMALAYVDARDVMDRLDGVCQPNGWQDEYSTVGGVTCCRIGIALHDTDLDRNATWIWKADGAGETAYEGAKGQFSDAFKRAAVKHGVGRYLYDCGAPWVDIEPRGKSYVIKSGQSDVLDSALAKAAALQQWGDRNTANMYRLFRDALKEYAAKGGDVDSFVKERVGTIAQLRVGAKRELEQEIERLRENQQEKAA